MCTTACRPKPTNGSAICSARRGAGRPAACRCSLSWRRLQRHARRGRQHRGLGSARTLCGAGRDGPRLRCRRRAAGPPPSRPGRDLPAAGAARRRAGRPGGHAARSTARRHRLGPALAGPAAAGHRRLRAQAPAGLRRRPQQRRPHAGAQPLAPRSLAGPGSQLRACLHQPGGQRPARPGGSRGIARAGRDGCPAGLLQPRPTRRAGLAGAVARTSGQPAAQLVVQPGRGRCARNAGAAPAAGVARSTLWRRLALARWQPATARRQVADRFGAMPRSRRRMLHCAST